MKLTLLILFFGAFVPCFGESPDKPSYRINTDYQQPRSKETFLYAVFMLDHDHWPKATRIAISRFGFAFVFEGIGERRYRFTPIPIAPHEFQEFVTLLHDKVRFTSIESHSKSRDEPYLLYMTAAYSQPSLSHHIYSVYSDATDAVRPLMEPLRQWQKSARDIWAARTNPEIGHNTIATLETDDNEFLEHMMDSIHYTSTWRREK